MSSEALPSQTLKGMQKSGVFDSLRSDLAQELETTIAERLRTKTEDVLAAADELKYNNSALKVRDIHAKLRDAITKSTELRDFEDQVLTFLLSSDVVERIRGLVVNAVAETAITASDKAETLAKSNAVESVSGRATVPRTTAPPLLKAGSASSITPSKPTTTTTTTSTAITTKPVSSAPIVSKGDDLLDILDRPAVAPAPLPAASGPIVKQIAPKPPLKAPTPAGKPVPTGPTQSQSQSQQPTPAADSSSESSSDSDSSSDSSSDSPSDTEKQEQKASSLTKKPVDDVKEKKKKKKKSKPSESRVGEKRKKIVVESEDSSSSSDSSSGSSGSDSEEGMSIQQIIARKLAKNQRAESTSSSSDSNDEGVQQRAKAREARLAKQKEKQREKAEKEKLMEKKRKEREEKSAEKDQRRKERAERKAEKATKKQGRKSRGKVEEDENGLPLHFPVELGAFQLLSLGTVVFDRPAYHNNAYVYPVGYKCNTSYYSTVTAGEKVSYTSEIMDGGDAPIFRVTAADAPEAVFEGSTPTAAWKFVSELAYSVKGDEEKHQIGGPYQFGFKQKPILGWLSKLPNIDKLSDYHPGAFHRSHPEHKSGLQSFHESKRLRKAEQEGQSVRKSKRAKKADPEEGEEEGDDEQGENEEKGSDEENAEGQEGEENGEEREGEGEDEAVDNDDGTRKSRRSRTERRTYSPVRSSAKKAAKEEKKVKKEEKKVKAVVETPKTSSRRRKREDAEEDITPTTAAEETPIAKRRGRQPKKGKQSTPSETPAAEDGANGSEDESLEQLAESLAVAHDDDAARDEPARRGRKPNRKTEFEFEYSSPLEEVIGSLAVFPQSQFFLYPLEEEERAKYDVVNNKYVDLVELQKLVRSKEVDVLGAYKLALLMCQNMIMCNRKRSKQANAARVMKLHVMGAFAPLLKRAPTSSRRSSEGGNEGNKKERLDENRDDKDERESEREVQDSGYSKDKDRMGGTEKMGEAVGEVSETPSSAMEAEPTNSAESSNIVNASNNNSSTISTLSSSQPHSFSVVATGTMSSPTTSTAVSTVVSPSVGLTSVMSVHSVPLSEYQENEDEVDLL